MDHRDGGFLRNLSLLQYGTPLIVNSCGICSSPQLRKRLGSSSSFVKRFQTEHRLRGHRGCVNCINFSFEGDQLVSGSDDLKIILWDWKKGRSIMSFPSQHVANIFLINKIYAREHGYHHCQLCPRRTDNLTAVPHELYLRNIYLIIATMTTTGYGDIPINYISDALFVSVITIIAKLLYSFIVGYYSSISSTPVVRQVDAKQDLDGLQIYMDENDLHGTKQMKVLHYIEYIWERNHGYHSTTLFADLPFSLKREIRLISTISAIGKVPFLSKLDKNFLSHLSLLLKSQYFIPGQFIVHKYDLRQCIYFISNGTVELYDNDDNAEVEKILYPSDIFCEETLFNSQPVQYSAKCVGYVDTYVLEKTDFEDMLVTYPEVIEAISSVVGKGWGIHYLHCSKARHLDTYQNVTLYEGIL